MPAPSGTARWSGLAAAALVAFAAACGDPENTRTFRLAASGTQLLVSGPSVGFRLTEANLAMDVDLVAVHQEFYGVPWSQFAAGTTPPPEWSAQMLSLAASARDAGQEVFLSVTPLNGGRTSLAARTVIVNGSIVSEDGWAAPCYDFATAADAATWRNAYIRYVEAMVDTFHPRYLNIAIELNLFLEQCPTAWEGMVDVVNAAYDAAKSRSPGTVVFPSIQIDHLYGVAPGSCPSGVDAGVCYDQAYARLGGVKRDRFAISSYPYLAGFAAPDQVPADWFSRGPARGGERPVIAETGWLSDSVVAQTSAGSCLNAVTSDESAEAAYLDLVLSAAERGRMDLVTWISDRDLLIAPMMADCGCHLAQEWCAVRDIFRGPPPTGNFDTQLQGELLLKAFGTMGLRAYDGTPKSAVYRRWQEAHTRPLAAN
jgi:hypothetical protein